MRIYDGLPIASSRPSRTTVGITLDPSLQNREAKERMRLALSAALGLDDVSPGSVAEPQSDIRVHTTGDSDRDLSSYTPERLNDALTQLRADPVGRIAASNTPFVLLLSVQFRLRALHVGQLQRGLVSLGVMRVTVSDLGIYDGRVAELFVPCEEDIVNLRAALTDKARELLSFNLNELVG